MVKEWYAGCVCVAGLRWTELRSAITIAHMPAKGPPRKYPYEEWFDGEFHVLECGVDLNYKNAYCAARNIKRVAPNMGYKDVLVRSTGKYVYVLRHEENAPWGDSFSDFWTDSNLCGKKTDSQT
jgi:hypothetical protein